MIWESSISTGPRYTRQKDDGYTETGSLSNATVSEATTEVFEAHLGIEVGGAFDNGGVLSSRLGGVFRKSLNGSGIDATVFSATESLTLASADFTGVSVALGYQPALFQNLHLELAAEQEIGTDAQGPFVRAGIEWLF